MSKTRDLFLKQKTESEVEAAISYYFTGEQALKEHVSDVYEVNQDHIEVRSGRNGTIEFYNWATIDTILICKYADLPKILKDKSAENYNALRQKEVKVEVHVKDLDDIRRRQFIATTAIKLKEPPKK